MLDRPTRSLPLTGHVGLSSSSIHINRLFLKILIASRFDEKLIQTFDIETSRPFMIITRSN
jgi:hypothetical protein